MLFNIIFVCIELMMGLMDVLMGSTCFCVCFVRIFAGLGMILIGLGFGLVGIRGLLSFVGFVVSSLLIVDVH